LLFPVSVADILARRTWDFIKFHVPTKVAAHASLMTASRKNKINMCQSKSKCKAVPSVRKTNG